MIDGQYEKLLVANQLDPKKVLQIAKLPRDTFAHQHLKLTEQEYFALINAIETLANDPLFATKLVASDDIETFSPPIFAAYCSKNGYQFLKRLAQYKKLIGPVIYELTSQQDVVTVTLTTFSAKEILPPFFVKSEFAFMMHLISSATNQKIKPVKITATFQDDSVALIEYYGVHFEFASSNTITFKLTDLLFPFTTENTSMLEYLEPELKKKLAELAVDESYAKRVRTALVELLPRGKAAIGAIAQSLGVSKRTLQRKLKSENTSFQQQLTATREMLAKNYLLNDTLTPDDIAFLLAYQETNSFLRAFNAWTGMSAQKYRQEKS